MIIAGLLAVLAALIPLVAIAGYGRIRAQQAEQAHLQEYSDWTLKRADHSFGRARTIMAKLQAENWHDCSPAHIARMRLLTIQSGAVDEIGYFIDGKLACTGWGVVPGSVDIRKHKPEVMLPDGFGLRLNVQRTVTGATHMLEISRGDYTTLISPDRLVDVLTDTDMTLGLATLDGRLVAVNGKVDPAVANRMAEGGALDRSDAYAGSFKSNGLLRAFAITDRSLVEARVDREVWVLIPVGLLVSAMLLGLIFWISHQRLSLERELAISIRRREFRVFYQPIMELSTGLCVGAEALLRWQRPDGSSVHPDFFIPFAEYHGAIDKLTDLMIDTVLSDLAPMLRRERSVHIAINISSSDMQSGRFLPVLDRAMAASGVAPRQIWLEATERGFMNASAARRTVDKARARGHLVAIDDFGTGYSSLSLLERLPLDTLKIDKSFVEAIGKGAATSVVVPHVIEMAHGLDLRIVAEGVETREQEAYLREAGVEFVQGWLYAKALSPAEFIAFFERNNAGRKPSFVKAKTKEPTDVMP
ncbi:EAL domain-containing protein [Novosphingobium sp. BL-8H]|uniref:EAL domain-containing protein n=1 Tax=Novosphingobium sp. BL-8H TaxID=3127640 RepID=UPI003756BB29